ncbi:hypothetical protein [Halostreptopolyspora alba]
MTPRGEQLVLNYLSAVGQASYGYLTARRRAAYLTELRSRIDQACDGTNPDEVRRVLASFGTPEELLARECSEDPDDEENGDGATDDSSGAPRHADREPPPWRGGPDRGLFGGRGATAVRDRSGGAPRGALLGLASAARAYPPEVFAISVYLVSALVGEVALVWAVGAALVILSDVWTRRDKGVAVAVPLVATAIGMALWEGQAPYIDQIILFSLVDTGVVGLRLAALGCVCYLLVRITRIARATES